MKIVHGDNGRAALDLTNKYSRRAYVPRDGNNSDGEEATEQQDVETHNGAAPSHDQIVRELELDICLSHEEPNISEADRLQYAAIKQLQTIAKKEDDPEEMGIVEQNDHAFQREQQDDEYDDEMRAAEHRGKKLVMMYDGSAPIRSFDPEWFILNLPDHFPNGTGKPPKGMSMKRWIQCLIRRDGSIFQEAYFICMAGDNALRAGVNLATYLSFKTSPSRFQTASRATSEQVKRVAEIVARRGRPKATDPPEVKALYSQVVAVSARVPGSPFNALSFKSKILAGWYRFGYYCVFYTLNPLETQSPFCWALMGVDGNIIKEIQQADMHDKRWEVIKQVRKHPVAQAEFFRIVTETFLKVCCGFSKPNQYYQDYDPNTYRPKGFYGPLDAVIGKREESGRLSHHMHGLLISRYFKLHDMEERMRDAAERVMNWMSSIASSVMSNKVGRKKKTDGTYAPVPKEVTHGMAENEIEYVDMKKHIINRDLPGIDDANPDEEAANEYITLLQQSQNIHYHASRCISKDGKKPGDDTGCAMGFNPGPEVIDKNVWNAESQTLTLKRSRRKIVPHNPPVTVGFKCNNCFMFIGDKSARESDDKNNDMTFREEARMKCHYCGKYTGKVDDHTGEELITNMVVASERLIGQDNEATGAPPAGPKDLVTKCVNAMHK